MEKNKKYLEVKRNYNSKLSTFQITKDLHQKVKTHCKNNGIKVRDFLEKLISDNL